MEALEDSQAAQNFERFTLVFNMMTICPSIYLPRRKDRCTVCKIGYPILPLYHNFLPYSRILHLRYLSVLVVRDQDVFFLVRSRHRIDTTGHVEDGLTKINAVQPLSGPLAREWQGRNRKRLLDEGVGNSVIEIQEIGRVFLLELKTCEV